ncbi:MAG: PLD nuclease N-terminal domain-containing protein [Thermodesulfobacteriota bacterium]
MTSTAVLIVVGSVIASYLMTCWALVDVAGRDFGAVEKKAAWGAVAFVPFIGWAVYLVWGRKRGKRREDAEAGR